MSENFPDQISPITFARNGKSIQQTLAIREFERACSMLANESGNLTVKLLFTLDESNLPILCGSVEATLQLNCQRCMEPMDITIESPFNMALIVKEAEEETLPEEYEALLVDEKTFSLRDFIEDELILAIPVIANHAADQCGATQFLQDATELPSKERENPFQVLEQLKK